MKKSKIVLATSAFVLAVGAAFATKMAKFAIFSYYQDGSVCRTVGNADCSRVVTNAACTFITSGQTSKTLYSQLKAGQTPDQPNTTCINTLHTVN